MYRTPNKMPMNCELIADPRTPRKVFIHGTDKYLRSYETQHKIYAPLPAYESFKGYGKISTIAATSTPVPECCLKTKPKTEANVETHKWMTPPTKGLFDLMREENNKPAHNPDTILRVMNPPTNPPYNKYFPPPAPEPRYNFTTFIREATMGKPIDKQHQVQSHAVNIIRTPQSIEHWVTVYGFEVQDAQKILKVFLTCGNILAKRFAPDNGNWVHLRYSTRAECDGACSFHKKILFGYIMIAVEHCEKDKLINNNKQGSLEENQNILKKVRPPHAVRIENLSYYAKKRRGRNATAKKCCGLFKKTI